MAGKGKITVFISTYESRKYVAMILDVQKLIATYIVRILYCLAKGMLG
jgi:hypothetical protein